MNDARGMPKLLVALLCATSINAASQSTSPPDVTRYTHRVPGTAGASVSDEALEAAVARELGADSLRAKNIAARTPYGILDAERFSYDPYADVDGGVGLPWEYPPADKPRTGKHAANNGPIADSVRSELWWSPFVNEEDIAVSVHAAVVTLKGTVDSEAERRAAIENAFEGGAVSVKSELVMAE